MKKRNWVWVVLFLVWGATPALAQGIFYTPDQESAAWDVNNQPSDWDITLAAGAAMQATFPGSDRYRVTPIPLAIIRWRDMVSLGVDGLNAYWHDGRFRIGGGVTYDGGRSDHETTGLLSSGDNRLKGLGNVDGSAGLRGFASYQWGPAFFDAAVVKYVGPDNKGVVGTFAISAPLKLLRNFVVRPHIGATWADSNYMRNFFGITPLQSMRSVSMFPAFSASDGLENANGGVTLVYFFTGHWFVGMDASMVQYLGSAGKSPITISNTNATVASVVGYHF